MHFNNKILNAFSLYILDGCKTVSGPDNNKPCIFPFKFQGITYNTCSTVLANENKPWCSTLVDNSGTHVSGGGHYGDCGSKCPMPTGKIFNKILKKKKL